MSWSSMDDLWTFGYPNSMDVLNCLVRVVLSVYQWKHLSFIKIIKENFNTRQRLVSWLNTLRLISIINILLFFKVLNNKRL